LTHVKSDPLTGVKEGGEVLRHNGVELWRQADAARWLGFSRQRVSQLLREGKLSFVTVRGVDYVEHASLMEYGKSVKQLTLLADNRAVR